MILKQLFLLSQLTCALFTGPSELPEKPTPYVPVTLYGGESSSRDQLVITLMKPDELKVSRVEVVSSTAIYVFETKNWVDPGLTTPSEEIVLTLARHNIDFTQPVEVNLYTKGKRKKVKSFVLDKRYVYGEDYLDFYSEIYM